MVFFSEIIGGNDAARRFEARWQDKLVILWKGGGGQGRAAGRGGKRTGSRAARQVARWAGGQAGERPGRLGRQLGRRPAGRPAGLASIARRFSEGFLKVFRRFVRWLSEGFVKGR